MAVISWGPGRIKTLPIANGQQISDTLDMGGRGTRRAYTVAVTAPVALTGIVTIQVSHAAEGPFSSLQSDNVDVELSASKGTVLAPFPFPYLRLSSSLAEGDDRDFVVIAVGA